jgi:hypothetical protein
MQDRLSVTGAKGVERAWLVDATRYFSVDRSEFKTLRKGHPVDVLSVDRNGGSVALAIFDRFEEDLRGQRRYRFPFIARATVTPGILANDISIGHSSKFVLSYSPPSSANTSLEFTMAASAPILRAEALKPVEWKPNQRVSILLEKDALDCNWIANLIAIEGAPGALIF